MSSPRSSEPPDYCWSSSFENGLFYIENWQTGHKYRVVMGLTEMSVQLLNARQNQTQAPLIKRITGLLHFLPDCKLNFCVLRAQDSAILGSAVVELTSSERTVLSPYASDNQTPPTAIAEAIPQSTLTSANQLQTACVGNFSSSLNNCGGGGQVSADSPGLEQKSEASKMGSASAIQLDPNDYRLKAMASLGLQQSQAVSTSQQRVAGGSRSGSQVPLSEKTCPICQRSFSNRSMLRRHLIVHSAVPRFTCNMCGKGFKYRWNYTNHVKEKCPRLLESLKYGEKLSVAQLPQNVPGMLLRNASGGVNVQETAAGGAYLHAERNGAAEMAIESAVKREIVE